MNAMTLGMNSNGAQKLGAVKIPEKYFCRFGTGIDHIDNMFGQGGFIKGQVITMSAMRGAGKTTALLQILQKVTKTHKGKKCIYISGEEYIEQLAFTANRLNTPDVLADNVTDADELCALTKKYDVMVIDSLAAVTSAKFNSDAKLQGYFINKMYTAAKENDCVVVIIMHMTKESKKKIHQDDLQKLDGADDIKVFERLTRRLKSLVDAGKVRKDGRGSNATYRMKG
jgi:predicted ATP-dependent serine protease